MWICLTHSDDQALRLERRIRKKVRKIAILILYEKFLHILIPERHYENIS